MENYNKKSKYYYKTSISIHTSHISLATEVGKGPNICFICAICFRSTICWFRKSLNRNMQVSSTISGDCSFPVIFTVSFLKFCNFFTTSLLHSTSWETWDSKSFHDKILEKKYNNIWIPHMNWRHGVLAQHITCCEQNIKRQVFDSEKILSNNYNILCYYKSTDTVIIKVRLQFIVQIFNSGSEKKPIFGCWISSSLKLTVV